MIKVEFTDTFNSEDNFFAICKELGLKYKKDPNYERHYAGCNAPNVGYIVYTNDYKAIRSRACRNRYVENLMLYD